MTDYINIRNDTEVGDASFAMSADTIDVGQSILFTNNSSTYDVWYWDFGDGTADSTSTPTSFSPSHLYGEFGEFEVKLTILYGCDTQVAFDTVIVLDTASTTAMR
jgi:PKD repeat protein